MDDSVFTVPPAGEWGIFAKEMLMPPRIIPLKMAAIATLLPKSLSICFLLNVSPFPTI